MSRGRTSQEEYGVLLGLTEKLEYAVAAYAADIRGRADANERARGLAVVKNLVARSVLSQQRFRRKALESVR